MAAPDSSLGAWAYLTELLMSGYSAPKRNPTATMAMICGRARGSAQSRASSDAVRASRARTTSCPADLPSCMRGPRRSCRVAGNLCDRADATRKAGRRDPCSPLQCGWVDRCARKEPCEGARNASGATGDGASKWGGATEFWTGASRTPRPSS